MTEKISHRERMKTCLAGEIPDRAAGGAVAPLPGG